MLPASHLCYSLCLLVCRVQLTDQSLSWSTFQPGLCHPFEVAVFSKSGDAPFGVDVHHEFLGETSQPIWIREPQARGHPTRPCAGVHEQ